MTRKEFVERLVLNEICDDYESLEHVSKWIDKDAHRCGLAIQPAEIVESLGELIALGLARAYLFREGARKPDEIAGMPAVNKIEGYYFWATPRGIDLQLSDGRWYPFDDADQLRNDWIPPPSEPERAV
jgi:hypothetical protein